MVREIFVCKLHQNPVFALGVGWSEQLHLQRMTVCRTVLDIGKRVIGGCISLVCLRIEGHEDNQLPALMSLL